MINLCWLSWKSKDIVSGVITALERTRSVMKLTSLSRDAFNTNLSSLKRSVVDSGVFCINLKMSARSNKANHSGLILKKLLRVKIRLNTAESFIKMTAT